MLTAKNISKQFAGVTALKDVSITLQSGMVTAIIGENGAGKSTLMKILSGVHTQYGGDILLGGRPVKFSGTKHAEEHGIVIIHQELNLVPYLSVAENIFLGREITNAAGILDTRQMNAIAVELLARLNLKISPATKIADIKVGHQQLVEIAKALYTNASVIIMDEPTSAISDKEIENLFTIIRELSAAGKAIAYISHKFKEVFEIADNYVVLRDGVSVSEGSMQSATQDMLIEKMTGRQVVFQRSDNDLSGKEVLLGVNQLSVNHPLQKNRKLFNDISFNLHQGEIIGVYGLMGAGRTEMMETIFGLHPGSFKGEVYVNGIKQKIQSPADAIKAGIALVPEDRKSQGLVLNQSVSKNISITVLQQMEWWGMFLSNVKERLFSQGFINRLSIKTASGNNYVQNLSGGNQQKIVISKWLATNPRVLLLDEPTRGIDVNAKSEIYKLMKSLAAEGMGIIMVSSELPEILSVSDRVLVMCEGALTADIPAKHATEQDILRYAIQKNN